VLCREFVVGKPSVLNLETSIQRPVERAIRTMGAMHADRLSERLGIVRQSRDQ